jgi:hypothetical protein
MEKCRVSTQILQKLRKNLRAEILEKKILRTSINKLKGLINNLAELLIMDKLNILMQNMVQNLAEMRNNSKWTKKFRALVQNKV